MSEQRASLRGKDRFRPKSDSERLRAVCEGFLYATRWAGDLGEPLPRSHRGSHTGTKLTVTEIRHERRVCRAVIEGTYGASRSE